MHQNVPGGEMKSKKASLLLDSLTRVFPTRLPLDFTGLLLDSALEPCYKSLTLSKGPPASLPQVCSVPHLQPRFPRGRSLPRV